jgi:hypothetical protein
VTLLGQERLAARDYNGAARHFDVALQIARASDSPWVLATSCLNRSLAAQHAGELETTRALLAEAETIYREMGDDRFLARVWLQLGYLALLENNIEQARGLMSEGLLTASALQDAWGMAEQLDGMAAVLAATGFWSKALVVAAAGEATWDSIGAAAHPADRRSRDRWLRPAIRSAGDAGAAARADGYAMAPEDAVAYALQEA